MLRWVSLGLAVLAVHYGISRERVRQIEVQAFKKLCKLLRSPANGNHQNAARAA